MNRERLVKLHAKLCNDLQLPRLLVVELEQRSNGSLVKKIKESIEAASATLTEMRLELESATGAMGLLFVRDGNFVWRNAKGVETVMPKGDPELAEIAFDKCPTCGAVAP